MADIERWITVNGVHIPIMKGESKASAVGRFIKNRGNAQKKAVKSKLKGMFRNPDSQDELQREILENSAKGILRNKRPTIKGEGTQKFKAKNAFAKQNEVEQKYRQHAENIQNITNKNNDKDLEYIKYLRENGASRSKIREAQAKMELNYNYGSSNANLKKLEGNYEGLKAYNRYMDSPMKYKLKAKADPYYGKSGYKVGDVLSGPRGTRVRISEPDKRGHVTAIFLSKTGVPTPMTFKSYEAMIKQLEKSGYKK